MKFAVIGWLNYRNFTYKDHECDSDYYAIQRAIVDALLSGGYRFSGEQHMTAPAGMPILNDGTRVYFSAEEWDGIMSLAYGPSWREGETKLPPRGVDTSKLRKRPDLRENFLVFIRPDAFDAIIKGRKTVELCIPDLEHMYICRGDSIEFVTEENIHATYVTRVEYFDSLQHLFEPLPYVHGVPTETGVAYRHKMTLIRRHRFGPLKTNADVLADFLKVYPKVPTGPYSIAAISFVTFETLEKRKIEKQKEKMRKIQRSIWN